MYYRKDICVRDLGGLFSGGLFLRGGDYYRNFTVYSFSSNVIHLLRNMAKIVVNSPSYLTCNSSLKI